MQEITITIEASIYDPAAVLELIEAINKEGQP